MFIDFLPLLTRSVALGFCSLAILVGRPAFGQELVFTTLAGAPGGSGSSDGRGNAARFNYPRSVACDDSGNLFVADTNNHTIRKITPDGVVTTFAGSPGEPGGADGTGSGARFNQPYGVAVDRNGSILVADLNNHALRKISRDGVVTTLSRFLAPKGVAVDAMGTVYVADAHTVYRITEDRVVPMLADSFNYPHGIAVDHSGNVYVTRPGNGGTIQKITASGVVSTVAGAPNHFGSVDGPGNSSIVGNPEGVAVDGQGNVVFADTGAHTIRKISPAGVVTTITGLASDYGCTDGTSGAARFHHPSGVAVDVAGNIYVADSGNHNIRKITAGAVTTFAGGAGSGRNDGAGNAARFDEPRGVAVDANGNVFVTDANNHAVRKITATGVVSTLAHSATMLNDADPFASVEIYSLAVDNRGNVFVGQAYDGSGWLLPNGSTIRRISPDGGALTVAGFPDDTGSSDGTAAAAQFHMPRGVAMDSKGNLFVADTNNHTVRKISPEGVVNTVAGAAKSPGSSDGVGNEGRFNFPEGVAADSLGNVFVADTGNHTIRKITTAGAVTTIAGLAANRGSDDGGGSAARFSAPRGLAVDHRGNVFVADTGNHTIRKISPDGVVTTVAGLATSSGSADGVGGAARFHSPTGLAIDEGGNVFVADSGNNTIRVGMSGQPTIVTQPLSQTVAPGRTVMFSVAAALRPAPAYQWQKDGVALPGATSAAFILPRVSAASEGNYRCVVTTATGSTTSSPALLTVMETATDAGRFHNVSFRAYLDVGRTIIAGFVIGTPGGKTVLVRGIGPALRPLGVAGALADPKLEVFNSGNQRLADNDDWPRGLAGVFASTGAFAFTADSQDAAVLLTLPPGSYTAVLSGVAGATGEAMIEIYEVL